MDDGREREREADEGVVAGWRLDTVNRGGPDGKGELMDDKGRVRKLGSSVHLECYRRYFPELT